MRRYVTATVIVTAGLALLLWWSRSPATSPSAAAEQQIGAFQGTIASCLRSQGIDYEPVERQPGSYDAVMPTPTPSSWWVHHGGFGILRDQAGEVEFDATFKDPNRHLLQGKHRERFLVALYGWPSGGHLAAAGSCYDLALRTAGFLEESRTATLPAPTARDMAAIAHDPSVSETSREATTCIEHSGIDHRLAASPEKELERRFRADGLLAADGRVRNNGPDLAAGQRLEERIAAIVADCRRRSGFDGALDRAWRSQLSGGER